MKIGQTNKARGKMFAIDRNFLFNWVFESFRKIDFEQLRVQNIYAKKADVFLRLEREFSKNETDFLNRVLKKNTVLGWLSEAKNNNYPIKSAFEQWKNLIIDEKSQMKESLKECTQ